VGRGPGPPPCLRFFPPLATAPVRRKSLTGLAGPLVGGGGTIGRVFSKHGGFCPLLPNQGPPPRGPRGDRPRSPGSPFFFHVPGPRDGLGFSNPSPRGAIVHPPPPILPGPFFSPPPPKKPGAGWPGRSFYGPLFSENPVPALSPPTRRGPVSSDPFGPFLWGGCWAKAPGLFRRRPTRKTGPWAGPRVAAPGPPYPFPLAPPPAPGEGPPSVPPDFFPPPPPGPPGPPFPKMPGPIPNRAPFSPNNNFPPHRFNKRPPNGRDGWGFFRFEQPPPGRPPLGVVRCKQKPPRVRC